MSFNRKMLVIPDKTRFDEHLVVTSGDVVIGDRSHLGVGIATDGRIFVGEHVIIDGILHSTHDVRIDMFSSIHGDIQSGGNVFLGEKVEVKGKLSLKGDLDVGDSVHIEKGFEAKGWINIRSPIPIMIYIFIYLLQLLKMGKSEEIERILEELEQSDGETIPISESFLFIPDDTSVNTSRSQVDGSLSVGKKCHLLGNHDVKGSISLDEQTEVFGSLEATENISCGTRVRIHGAVTARGFVSIGDQAEIIGDIAGKEIILSKTAIIHGKLLGEQGVSFLDSSKQQATERVKRFEADVDVVDDVKEMLE